MSIAEIKERHAKLLSETRSFLDACESAAGGMSEDDYRHFEKLQAATADLEAASNGSGLSAEDWRKLRNNQGWTAREFAERLAKERSENSTDFPVFRAGDGTEIVARAGNQTFSDKPLNGELGHAIHSLLRGDIMAAQVGSTDSSGGYLLNPSFSSP